MIYTIYGRPKVGKTTLALSNVANPDKVLVLDSDRGLAAVDTSGMRVVSDLSQDSLSSVLDVQSLSQYDTVVIDTATQLYEDILRSLSDGRAPSLQQRGVANSNFLQIVRFLRQPNLDVILLAQEKVVTPTEDWSVADAEEEVTASVTIDLPPGAAKGVIAMSDVIGRLYMASVDGHYVRRLWLAPTPNIVAGARSRVYRGNPPYLTKPSIKRLKQLLSRDKIGA